MRKLFTLLLIALLNGTAIIQAQDWTKNLPQDKLASGDLTFYEIQKAFNDYWEPFDVGKNGYYLNNGDSLKAGGWKQFRRWEYYWEDRIEKETGKFPETSAYEELQEALLKDPGSKSLEGNWSSLGPNTTLGGYEGLGRLNCVGFVSGNNSTFYAGAASGGIWKTTNGGSSWTPLGDNNPVLGVSDMAVVPGSDPHIIYIATGDKNGGISSLGGGQWKVNHTVGVLKSSNGGTTWNSTGLAFLPSEQRIIYRLLMHPTNSNILYAATSWGLYKTTDGAENWTELTSMTFCDLEFKPGSPSTIYASDYNGDIYRSIDNGVTWTQTLSTSHVRTELAVSADNTALVYAVISNSDKGLAGIYKSTNSGGSFTQVFNGATTNLLNWDCGNNTSGGQGWYDLCIAADPTNANNVFVGGVNTWRSTSGGTSWSLSNHWTSAYGCGVPEVHGDKHYLAYQNGTSTLFECNDGGLYKTTNNGSSWTHLGNGLVISQIYRLGVAQSVANENIIGLQDNGTKSYLSGAWYNELGGDGFECAIDYTNVNTMYGELYYGDIRRSTNHGSTWSAISSGLTGEAHWCTPFVIDPNVNTKLYIGYQDVFRSTNQGTSWTKISNFGGTTLRSLAVAKSNSNVIYAATSNIIRRTTDGGTSWSNITGTLPVGSNNITYIAVKYNNANTVWVSLGGYNSDKVYQTTNGGATWTNISDGLPSIPVMCVIQNRQITAQDQLYAGTDVGIYVKHGNSDWTMFSSGLPNVLVTELEIYYASNPVNSRIRAATYGRGLWQSDLYTLPVPEVYFTADNEDPAIGQTVSFTDLTEYSPTSWAWEFWPSSVTYVEGTSSTSQNPKVKFNESGSYDVTLTASNEAGPGSLTRHWYISVLYPPVPDFSASEVHPVVGQKVVFSDLSTNLPSSWNWSFSPETVTFINGTGSSSKNPEVIFNSVGSYSVTLVSTNGSGSSSVTKTNFININTSIINLDLTVFLEGPFEGTGMTPGNIDYIPLSQPYNTPPWNYNGQESMTSITNFEIVDWVLIDVLIPEISEGDTTLIRLGRKAALLLSDGSVRDADQASLLRFPGINLSPVYIRVIHRNHLDVISSLPLNQSDGKFEYDFSTDQGKVFGGAKSVSQLSSGVWGLKSGDGNGNGQIENSDKNEIWVPQNNMIGYHLADYDMNIVVDLNDLNSKWKGNSGSGIHAVTVEINEAPLLPLNPVPADGTSNHPFYQSTLSWIGTDSENDPLTYDFYFGTEYPPTLYYSGMSVNYVSFYDFDFFTTYYWKVVVRDDHNHYTEGPVWSFSTGYIPGWSCGNDSLFDGRNDEIYSTVQIGNQCWMAQNLNIGDMLNYPVYNQSNNGWIEKYCYNNNEDSCSTLGGLYEWDEMMQYVTEPSSQGICPDGWHIPSDQEWCTAIKLIDPTVDCYANGWSGLFAGLHMKDSIGWAYWQGYPGNGSNTSGFTAKPTGSMSTFSPYFGGYRYASNIWSSTVSGANYAYYRGFSYNNSQDYRGTNTWDKGHSVRCLMYTNQPPYPPSNPQPADWATYVPQNVTLSWTCSDFEFDTLTYDVYISDYVGTLWIVSSGQTETTYTPDPGTLWFGLGYQWQIIAHDSEGNSTEGPVWHFTMVPQ